MMRTSSLALAFCCLLATAPTAIAGGTPAQQCVTAKRKAAGKKLAAKMGHAKAAKITELPVDSGYFAKVEAKFGSSQLCSRSSL